MDVWFKLKDKKKIWSLWNYWAWSRQSACQF